MDSVPDPLPFASLSLPSFISCPSSPLSFWSFLICRSCRKIHSYHHNINIIREMCLWSFFQYSQRRKLLICAEGVFRTSCHFPELQLGVLQSCFRDHWMHFECYHYKHKVSERTAIFRGTNPSCGCWKLQICSQGMFSSLTIGIIRSICCRS